MIRKQKAGCIIISKNNPQNILLIQTSYHGESLAFPKGHLEDGETLEECAIRETREETGIKVKLIKKLGICERPDYYCNELGEILFFLAESLSDEIDQKLKNDNSTTVFWANYKEVLNLNLMSEYKDFYTKYFEEIEKHIN